MTWIETREPTPENPELLDAVSVWRGAYPPEYNPGSGGAFNWPEEVRRDSIVFAHSLLPEVLRHVFAGYGALLDPKLPLERRHHEMIATLVSALNRCFY